MSKQDHKPHHKAEGVKLTGSFEELVRLMITDDKKATAALEEIANEGPKHKQVLSALLLKRLHKLVDTVEKNTGTKFSLQKGVTIVSDHHDNKNELPVAMPIVLPADADKEKIAELVGHAPQHEALAYIMTLQVVEWLIKNQSVKAN